MRPRRAWNTFRYGGGGAVDLKSRLNDTYGVTIASILDPSSHTRAEGAHALAGAIATHYDLLKLDSDGPEGGWVRAIDKMLTAGAISVDTMVNDMGSHACAQSSPHVVHSSHCGVCTVVWNRLSRATISTPRS